MFTFMDKNNIKDNILRECYYHPNRGVETAELRNLLMNDGLIEECCKELIKDDYLTKLDYSYLITPKGMEFVSTSSFSCTNIPIVYS